MVVGRPEFFPARVDEHRSRARARSPGLHPNLSDLFPRPDLTYLGLIPDSDFGWPIGFSRKEVKHLGSLPAVDLNCAACHVAGQKRDLLEYLKSL